MPQHHLPQTQTHLSPNYHPHGHGHHHSLSVSGSTTSGGFLFPPPTDFLASLSGGSGGGPGSNANNNNANNAFLTHNTLPLPPIRSLSPGSANKGHYRRASSGSRSERGAESWSGVGGGGGLLPSRVSPYPTPNASPRVRYDDLPPVPGSAGYEGEVALSGRMGMGVVGAYGGFGGNQPQQQQQQQQGDAGVFGNEGGRAYDGELGLGVGDGGIGGGQVVSKPTVTTGRTANASHKRRKQEATFVCPIPGCGSTFTRSFNLKGWFF